MKTKDEKINIINSKEIILKKKDNNKVDILLSFLFCDEYFLRRNINKKRNRRENDLFLSDVGRDISEQRIKVNNIYEKRINHIAYLFGVFLSNSYYEIRFDGYKDYMNSIGREGRTSSRVVIPSNASEWIEWSEKNYYPLTHAEGGRRSIDFYQGLMDIGFINKDWWGEKKIEKNIIIFRFDGNAQKGTKEYNMFHTSLKKIISFIEDRFGYIDKKEFNKYLQLGINLIPINSLGVFEKSKKILRSNNEFSYFCKKNINFEEGKEKYQTIRLKNIIKMESIRNIYDPNTIGYRKFIIIDSIKWGGLNDGKSFAIRITDSVYGPMRRNSFSDKQRFLVFEMYNFNVFNTKNNCFSKVGFEPLMIVSTDTFYKSVFSNRHKSDNRYLFWANQKGGPEHIEILREQANFEPFRKYFMNEENKIFTIEIHHFPAKNKILNLKYDGFPLYSCDLAIPLFTPDHGYLYGMSEEQQIEYMINNKWKEEEDIIKFAKENIKKIRFIEQENGFPNDLSKEMSYELRRFIK